MPAAFDTGFVVRQPAWHGLATVLDDYPDNWAEARRLAGLDWEPIEVPVYLGQPETPDTIFGGEQPLNVPTQIQGWKGLIRSDNRFLLHVHQDSYEPFANAELGPLVETFLDEPEVKYETAGVLNGGRQVWVLLRLANPFEIPGDPAGAALSYLAVQNSHDGSGALRAQRTQIRIVCANTSAAADRESARHGLEYSFRHTSNMRDRIEEAKAAINGLREDQIRYREWAEELLGIRITPEQRELFISEFVPDPPAESLISVRVRNNIERARGQVRKILDSPTTQDTAHTAYGLVQASIEYLDHARNARTQESRFRRTMLSTDGMKRTAEKLAREVALA